ncbi:hypothetical protein WN944_026062 [Citrus x changshan-huyou]|uniref:Uncharacterized protein n=1 Tax=Citrus x changshan-huyou TaxID=2935761 RepID=A0AAP0QDK2_9ROSI
MKKQTLNRNCSHRRCFRRVFTVRRPASPPAVAVRQIVTNPRIYCCCCRRRKLVGSNNGGDGNDSAEVEKPRVQEDIKVRRIKKLMLRRPYNASAEDGSGWVSVEKKPDCDMSPPRKQRTRKDSPSPEPEPRARNDSPSPEPRLKPARESPDLSPPRQQWNWIQNLGISAQKDSSRNEKGIQRTGLIKGNDIWEENSKRKKEDLLRFQEVYPSGLAQKRDAEARLQELEREEDKPFAQTRDDPELEKMLKGRLRWGDPRKHSKLVLQELGGNKKMKESGFIIPQGIPSHSWMQWGLDATLNRYGIRPGRQWDGVNHSLMDARTKCSKELMRKQAKEREAYLRLWDDLGSAKEGTLAVADENQDGKDGSYIHYYMKEHRYSAAEEA